MSVNKWIGIGNLTKAVECRYTPNGTAVANFTLACNDSWKDKNGDMQDKTEFVKIVAWARLGEICGEYLHKGSQVYIEGRLQTRSWDDRDGNKKYTTEIVAQTMKMLGSKKKGDNLAGDTGVYSSQNEIPEGNIPF